MRKFVLIFSFIFCLSLLAQLPQNITHVKATSGNLESIIGTVSHTDPLGDTTQPGYKYLGCIVDASVQSGLRLPSLPALVVWLKALMALSIFPAPVSAQKCKTAVDAASSSTPAGSDAAYYADVINSTVAGTQVSDTAGDLKGALVLHTNHTDWVHVVWNGSFSQGGHEFKAVTRCTQIDLWATGCGSGTSASPGNCVGTSCNYRFVGIGGAVSGDAAAGHQSTFTSTVLGVTNIQCCGALGVPYSGDAAYSNDAGSVPPEARGGWDYSCCGVDTITQISLWIPPFVCGNNYIDCNGTTTPSTTLDRSNYPLGGFYAQNGSCAEACAQIRGTDPGWNFGDIATGVTAPAPTGLGVVATGNITCLLNINAGSSSYSPGTTSCAAVGGATITITGTIIATASPSPGVTPSPGSGGLVCSGSGVCGAQGVLDTIWTTLQNLLTATTQLPAQIRDSLTTQIFGTRLATLPSDHIVWTPITTITPPSTGWPFPFSVPYDIKRIVDAIDVSPTPWTWDLHFYLPQWGIDQHYNVGVAEMCISASCIKILDYDIGGGVTPILLIRWGELLLIVVGVSMRLRNWMGDGW